jgi:arylsulfatase A-like enzyme
MADVLKKLQLWAGTMFVVTGDHGEEFLEHGNRYHSPIALTEHLIRVPLLIHGRRTAANVTGPFSLIHLAPTLLEALDVNVPSNFRGRPLWKEVSSGSPPHLPAIVECLESCNSHFSVADRRRNRLIAVIDGEHKLFLRFSEKSDQLYDLKDDPEERRPLPDGVQGENRARLMQFARDHLRDSRQNRDKKLALRSRLREIRQGLGLKRGRSEALGGRTGVEIGEHG